VNVPPPLETLGARYKGDLKSCSHIRNDINNKGKLNKASKIDENTISKILFTL
jgi:hypothetical protein